MQMTKTFLRLDGSTVERPVRIHGWVEIRPGQLRPAYRDGGHDAPVVYSPGVTDAWRDAPEAIAATWVFAYVEGEWRPNTAPEGMRIVDF